MVSTSSVPAELPQIVSFEAERRDWERQRHDLEQRCVQLTVERDLAIEEKAMLLAEVSHLQSELEKRGSAEASGGDAKKVRSTSGTEEDAGAHEQRSLEEELFMCREALKVEKMKTRELKKREKIRTSEWKMEVQGLSDQLEDRLDLEEQLAMLQSELVLSRERCAQAMSQQNPRQELLGKGLGKPTSWAGTMQRGEEEPAPGPAAQRHRETAPRSGKSPRCHNAVPAHDPAMQRRAPQHLEHHEPQRSPRQHLREGQGTPQHYREAQEPLRSPQQQYRDVHEQHRSPQPYREASPRSPSHQQQQQQYCEAQEPQRSPQQQYREIHDSQWSPQQQYRETSPRSPLPRQFREASPRSPQQQYLEAHETERAYEQRPPLPPQQYRDDMPHSPEAPHMTSLNFYGTAQSPRSPRCTGQMQQGRARHVGQKVGAGRRHTPAC